jgi:GDSL-like lipase/acylhydrolase family protein
VIRRAVGLVLAIMVSASVSVRAQNGVDFTMYVAIGDGFTAGMQDGALHAASQQAAYPVLVANAAATTIALPLLAEPGVPTPNPVTGLGLLVQRPGTCDYTELDLATGRSTGRLDPALHATNVAVPYQTVGDAIGARWSIDPTNSNDPDSFEDFVLGFPYVTTRELPPSTQLETAVALHPTFVTVWIGNMDALDAVIAGQVDTTTLTPENQFEQRATVLFDSLATTGAKGAIVNVPNVTSSAYLVSQRELRKRTRLTTKQLRNRLGVEKTSYVPITALPTVDAIAAGDATGPLEDSQILTKQELNRIQAAIDAYNGVLAAEARRLGWALVDLNKLYAIYEKHGVDVAGVGRLTTGYLGGLYGLDGIHPSDTGQALIATAVIAALNDRYGLSLTLPNLAEIAASDPHTCGAVR